MSDNDKVIKVTTRHSCEVILGRDLPDNVVEAIKKNPDLSIYKNVQKAITLSDGTVIPEYTWWSVTIPVISVEIVFASGKVHRRDPPLTFECILPKVGKPV